MFRLIIRHIIGTSQSRRRRLVCLVLGTRRAGRGLTKSSSATVTRKWVFTVPWVSAGTDHGSGHCRAAGPEHQGQHSLQGAEADKKSSPDPSQNPASFKFSSGQTDGSHGPEVLQPDESRPGWGGSVRLAASPHPPVAPGSVAGGMGGPGGFGPLVSAKEDRRCLALTWGTEVFRIFEFSSRPDKR